jgi:glycosyltransferase involved in cell wall biosynthesis
MSVPREILHYTGYTDDRGGIVAVVRALHGTGMFSILHGVSVGFVATGATLPLWIGPTAVGESITLRNFWRARAVARAVQSWLREAEGRVYHGHSRAGLLVGLWLHWFGESRFVVSVHCYGRQRWFYRWAARQLGARIFWLSPAMKKYYSVGDDSWMQCVSGCLAFDERINTRRAHANGVIRLGGIGALVGWKNWALVLQALSLLPGRERFHFRHIGADNGSPDSLALAAGLREATKTEALGERVEWLGQQPSSAAFLEEIDCLLVTSECEPFSVAMMEALRAGVPVLAADSGGACDIVVEGKNGWLFRSGDARDLARKLAMLAEGPALAEVVIEQASLQRFSAAAVGGQWAEIYGALGAP